VPHDVDNLTDRARARAMHGDWDGAESDLTIALAGDPERADLLVLRASAYHAMGKKTEALADIAHALDILPSYPEALLERGSIRLENGDLAGARSDWQTVAAKASDAAQAATARERLQQLDAAAAPPKPAKRR
jgi:regulator of sirC expression with transglutaminase-like and TPR domain